MSAYSKIKCQFRDKDTLVTALKDLGYSPSLYDLSLQLEDYHGHSRPERAEIIIPRSQLAPSSNDIGFAKQSDGTYLAIISQYDQHVSFNPAKLEKLKLQYNLVHAKKIARQQCMKLVSTRSTEKNGKMNVLYVFEPRQ